MASAWSLTTCETVHALHLPDTSSWRIFQKEYKSDKSYTWFMSLSQVKFVSGYPARYLKYYNL